MNVVTTLAPLFLIESPSFLQITRITIKSLKCSKFNQMGPQTVELAPLERLEKIPQNYNGRNVTTLLDGSSSFLQVSRTTINA